jgi:hypothetical protein
LHGDLAGALHFHPLVLVLAPLFSFALGKAFVDYVQGPRSEPVRSPPPTWWTGRPGFALASGLLVLVVGVWALRFAGYFGGPVPVVSYREWRAHHGPPSLTQAAPLTR